MLSAAREDSVKPANPTIQSFLFFYIKFFIIFVACFVFFRLIFMWF